MMKIVEEFRGVLTHLATDNGWARVFDALGVMPSGEGFEERLTTPLDNAQQVLADLGPGFVDLATGASRPVEPAKPARSILFHALASPGVTTGPMGQVFTIWPTPGHLEVAENLVYALAQRSLDDVKALADGAPLAAVVFAREYRDAGATPHGLFADMTYARTGVTRVGTLPPSWHGSVRAFRPLLRHDDAHAFRVLPCRYGVYLAARLKGGEAEDRLYRPRDGDDGRDFWLPIHKLFAGDECLHGMTLEKVDLQADHINEKLWRIHQHLRRDEGFVPPKREPYIRREGLAEFSTEEAMGPGVLVPVPHEKLVDEVTDSVLMDVEDSSAIVFGPTFRIASVGMSGGGFAHKAPEYVHVRTKANAGGGFDDLNLLEASATLGDGGPGNIEAPWKARHYTDYSADGIITAIVEGLDSVDGLEEPRPAFSLVSAPDFYPYVDQARLSDWFQGAGQDYDTDVLGRLFQPWRGNLQVLADERSFPNLSENMATGGFDTAPDNRTITAVMAALASSPQAGTDSVRNAVVARVSTLPDAASSTFAPGWDVSVDALDNDRNNAFVTNYGLGSPFPEDAKLCAALSAFWPAVAPDTSRQMSWNRGAPLIRPSIAPLNDLEMGHGLLPSWDGVRGPQLIRDPQGWYIETENWDHIDYTLNALEGRFSMAQTMTVSQGDYQERVNQTMRAYSKIQKDMANYLSQDGFAFNELYLVSLSEDTASTKGMAAEAGLAAFSSRITRFVFARPDSTRESRLYQRGDTRHWTRTVPVDVVMTLLMSSDGQIDPKVEFSPNPDFAGS
ncbi:MAG: hypothetical protein AAFQ10_02650 [Pseudomonadota bacterium]